MAITRRDFMASTSAIGLIAFSSQARAWKHGVGSAPPSGNSPIVVNMGGGGPAIFEPVAFTNIAKQWNPVGPPSLFGGANTNPIGDFTGVNNQSDILIDPNYYGRYTLSWTVTSGTPGIYNISPYPMIVYSGADHCTISGISPAASGTVAGANVIQSGASGANIEFDYGLFVNAVGVDNSTGVPLVKFTSTGTNYAFIFSSTDFAHPVTLVNITGIPAGPWQVNFIDFNNFSLIGSTAYVGLVGLTTAGNILTNSKVIYSMTTVRASLNGDFTGSGFNNLVFCETPDLTDLLAGKLVKQSMVDAFKNTNAAYIRFMDAIAVQAIQGPPFAQRTTPSTFSWGLNYTPIACYAGVMTNTADTFTCPINPSNSPQGAGAAYVDGEIIVAQVGSGQHNTTNSPKLGITGRAAAKRILNNSCSPQRVYLTGAVPVSNTTLSLTFNGGGLNNFVYHYQTSTSVAGPAGVFDDTLEHIADNITTDIRNNSRGNSAAFVSANWYAFWDGFAYVAFSYCSNLNAAGAASLGNGASIVGNDPTSSVIFTANGFVDTNYLYDGAVVSFTYVALFQAWVATPARSDNPTAGGMRGAPPIEFYAELCARANSGMWYNIGVFDTASNIYNQVLTIAQAQYNGQNAVKTLALEWGNETWLALQPPTDAQAWALGFLIPSGGSGYSLHGLRTLQMAQQATQAWSDAGRSRADLKIVNAYQFVQPIPGPLTSLTNIARFNGQFLNGASGTRPALSSFGGLGATAFSIDASTAPNRPIDWCDWISPAPYLIGGQMNAAFGVNLEGGTISNEQDLLLAAYNYAYGNSTQQTAALDFLFNIGTGLGDFYKGTLHDGTKPNSYEDPGWLSLGSGDAYAGYAGAGVMVAAWDASRLSNGTSGGAQLRVGIGCYEGGWQMGPLSAGELVNSLNNLGYTNGYSSSLAGAAAGPSGAGDTSTTASANIYKLLQAWKYDARCFAWATKMFGDLRTTANAGGTREALFAWYGWQTSNVWSLYPGLVTGAAPYQPYNAIAAWR